MQEAIIGFAQDVGTVTFWAKLLLPVVGSQAIAQIWKLWRRDVYGSKPKGYIVATVAALTCAILTTLVWHAFPTSVKSQITWEQAVGWGMLVGPASPILWIVFQNILHRFAPGFSMSLRGERRKDHTENRRVWTQVERDEHTMFDDTTNADEATDTKKVP